MNQFLKAIISKSNHSLTLTVLIVGILMGCQNPYEEVITKDEKGGISSVYTIRKADGLQHGIYKKFIDGKLSESGSFKEGKQDGVRQLFFENGKTEVEETYLNGNIIAQKTFYKNGQLKSEGQYDKALTMSGEWIYYYQNGNKKEIVNFKNSIEDGSFKEFHENGNLKAEGTYIPFSFGEETEGLEQGELKEYDESGKLVTKKYCENGICKVIWSIDAVE